MSSFFVALVINMFIFIVSWEPFVQSHAKAPFPYLMYFFLYFVGMVAFFISWSNAKKLNDHKTKTLSEIGIALAAGWILLSIFVMLIGLWLFRHGGLLNGITW